MNTNSRRNFLAACLGGVGAAVTGVALYPVYRYLAPRQVNASTKTVEFPVKDVPEGEVKFFEYAGASAVVVRRQGGDIVALSAVCTHLGCIVQWQKDKQEFLCPCHAGRYTADGAVISGPPPRPLAKLPVTVANGTITVG
ncbi:MAG TPA: ubiquinol-cytochrome c reductase iron-sulfur subunit [Geobacteraceae bacterium]